MSDTDENPSSDAQLLVNALGMWANWIETGDPIMSANDCRNARKKYRQLQDSQVELVKRLRSMAAGMDSRMQASLSYSELINELKDLPMTYYPAILGTVVQAAYAKKVFKPGRIHVFVKGVEDKCELNQRTGQEPRTPEASSPTNPTTPG